MGNDQLRLEQAIETERSQHININASQPVRNFATRRSDSQRESYSHNLAQGDTSEEGLQDDFLLESQTTEQIIPTIRQSIQGVLPTQQPIGMGNPDKIDTKAVVFERFIPSYKLEPKQRIKFFNKNKTSNIQYPKGISLIENYLVSMTFERSPEQMLISSYKEQSKLICDVLEYVTSGSKSSSSYRGNILCTSLEEELDSITPMTKNYHDGGKYYGTFKELLRHGFGKYYFNNGDIYEGIWKDNQRHEEGIYYYQNGEVYRGHYKLGQREGFGAFNYKNGDRYEGEWSNGNINGFGSYHYSIGETYMGYYIENKRCGRGRYIYKNGIIYDGNWDNGNQKGIGCYIYGNGVYMGECDMGFRHGKGVYLFKDGSCYEGNWIKGKREGWGVYKYANGSKYTGEHKTGYREGAGMYEYFNNEVYKGNWKKDKKNGYGVTILTDKGLQVGYYNDNVYMGASVSDRKSEP